MAKRKSVEVEEEREDVEEETSESERESEEEEEGSDLSGSEEEEEGEEGEEEEDVEGDMDSQEEDEEEVDDVEGDVDSREEEGNGEEEDGEREEEGEGRSSAFGRAFGKIMKKRVPQTEFTELLGPVLADRKQLLVKQFEAEELAKKAKISSKEQRREVSGKGHVLPQTYTDAKEKALIKLATRGVVRLFNAVTKAQKVQLEADASSSKAAKAVWKQSKAAFMTELGAGTKGERGSQADAMPKDNDGKDTDGGWAVLRSDFMLGASNKLKDWDKNLTNSVPT